MIGFKSEKIGDRYFLTFADGLVPVDQVKAIRRAEDGVRVELAGDSGYSARLYAPHPPDPPAER